MTGCYLALGDSITAGYGVGSRNFASLFYSYLRQGNPNLRFVNYGILGLTSARLANLLCTESNLQKLVVQAEIISLTICSNDLLQSALAFLRGASGDIASTLFHSEQNLDIIGRQIRSLNPNAIVKAAAVYNPLPAGPHFQYSSQAQAIINRANKTLVHWAKRYGFRIVPVDKAFRGRERLLIGSDHIHPNLVGHQIIAAEFMRL